MAKEMFVIATFLNKLMIPDLRCNYSHFVVMFESLRCIYLHFVVMFESLWPVKTLTNMLNIDNAAEKYYPSYAYQFAS